MQLRVGGGEPGESSHRLIKLKGWPKTLKATNKKARIKQAFDKLCYALISNNVFP